MSIKCYIIVKRRKKKNINIFERLHHELRDYTLRLDVNIDEQQLLSNKNIIPYWIDFTTKNVIFAQLPDASVLSHASFISDGIYELAEKLFFAPFSVFISLASKIEYLKTEVMLGLTVPRSGSTLLCKIIAHTTSVFVMSEPVCLSLIYQHSTLQSPYSEALFKSLMLFFTNFAHNQGKKRIYIKPYLLPDYEIVDRFFSIQTKKIITWRGPFEMIESVLKKSSPIKRTMRRVFSFFWRLRFRKLAWYKTESYQYLFGSASLSAIKVGVCVAWIIPMLGFVKQCKKVGTSRPLVLHYDDMISCHPKKLIMSILEHLNLESEFSEEMLTTMALDSQAGTTLGRHISYPLSYDERKHIKQKVDEIIDQYAPGLFLPRVLL